MPPQPRAPARWRGLAASALMALLAAPAGAAGRLNDTGEILCLAQLPPGGPVAISSADCWDPGTAAFPAQDAHLGRDAAQTAGTLVKTGAGPGGFDWLLIAADGTANVPLGQQACIYDNVTGLLWSNETLGSARRPLTWDAAMAAGAHYDRCGHADGWRLPTWRELLSIVDFGAGATFSTPPPRAINAYFFPHIGPDWYWTADEWAGSPGSAARIISFDTGQASFDAKSSVHRVHLVRTGRGCRRLPALPCSLPDLPVNPNRAPS